MALPVYTRTWKKHSYESLVSLGNVTRDDLYVLYCAKEAMVASGAWAVRASSAGASVSASDLWVYPLTAMSTGGNWCILTHSSGFEICLQHDSYGDNGVYLSRSVAFSYTTSYVTPTSSGRILLGTWNTTSNTGSAQAGYRMVQAWTTPEGHIRAACFYSNASTSSGYVFTIDSIGSPRAELTWNWIFHVGPEAISNLSGGSNFNCYLDGVWTTVRMTALGNASGWLVEQAGYSATLPDGEWAIQPGAYWICETAEKFGIVGKTVDWFFCHPNVVRGSTMPSTGEKTHIVYNNLVLPWDGTASWSP